mgnify:CR=1 FL=1
MSNTNTSRIDGNTFTVSSIDGIFASLALAHAAWVAAGSPHPRGSSVWATEHSPCGDTIATTTLARARG